MADAMDADADPSREGDYLAEILEVFPAPDDSDPAGAAVRRLVMVLLKPAITVRGVNINQFGPNLLRRSDAFLIRQVLYF